VKLRLLTIVLLLAAVPGWAEEGPAPATASLEPLIVEVPSCDTALMTPATAAEVAATPFSGDAETMTQALIPACIGCRELVTKCHSPGKDAGKACGDGDPPNTCTCQWCDHTFGCFP